MKTTVNFIEHHGDHTHARPTEVDAGDYLLSKGVTFHFRNDGEHAFVLWTETAGGQRLAEVAVDPSEVAFDIAWAQLRDGTLDVLSVGECE